MGHRALAGPGDQQEVAAGSSSRQPSFGAATLTQELQRHHPRGLGGACFRHHPRPAGAEGDGVSHPSSKHPIQESLRLPGEGANCLSSLLPRNPAVQPPGLAQLPNYSLRLSPVLCLGTPLAQVLPPFPLADSCSPFQGLLVHRCPVRPQPPCPLPTSFVTWVVRV